MKAIMVQTNTPIEKGTYSFFGAGIVFCSPCCGNTFYTEPAVAERSPLTVGPLFCPACGKEFCITHGEIVQPEPLRVKIKPPTPKVAAEPAGPA